MKSMYRGYALFFFAALHLWGIPRAGIAAFGAEAPEIVVDLVDTVGVSVSANTARSTITEALPSDTAAVSARFCKTISLRAGASQFRESYNHGLVFSGPELAVGFGITPTQGFCRWFYAADLQAGVAFRHKMPAYAIGFTPLHGGADFCFPVREAHLLRLRIALALSFHWQMYPFLQNSHLFYEAEIPLTIGLGYRFRSSCGILEAQADFSVCGFASSTSSNEPYFYKLDFHEFVGKPLQELRFGSLNTYVRVSASLEWSPASLRGHAFGLAVRYVDIHRSHRYQNLNYSLSWKKVF